MLQVEVFAMTLPVDRDQRRMEVAQAAYAIVAEKGLEMLTVRAVAKAKGCSTAVVSHYFTDKRDLLVAVYSLAAGLTFANWQAVEEGGGNLCDCLVSVLPIDPAMQGYWRVHLSFWSAAVFDATLREIQSAVLIRSNENVQRLLALDPIGRTLDLQAQRRISRQILSLQMGIATQAFFGDRVSSADRQRSDMAEGVAKLLREDAR
jgi:TetR/AcrR family transcriptional regulator, transcriptional repressor of bet genes